MKPRNPVQTQRPTARRWTKYPFAAILIAALCAAALVQADVPLRALPSGAVPNPGTQQQELTNITAPAEFNVFEFVVTCAGCHGGTIDLHAAHFGNWAGGNMASAARDPVFRANQIGVNAIIKSVTGQDGAGNVCFRCHSPNGWLSGRFDPTIGGKADGSNLIQSILLSTDAEGVMCETCHRVAGSVTNKRADLNAGDPVWKLLDGIFDWPHEGRAATDQDNDATIGVGLPFGDTSLQFQDSISYVGKHSGTGDLYFSDLPLSGSDYTGQIYAVYPDWWITQGRPRNPVPPGQPETNSVGQYLAYGPDGTLSPVLEVPVDIPTVGGTTDFSLQSLSLEHPTTGSAHRSGSVLTLNTALPALPPGTGTTVSPNEFIRTSEFCGSCHDLTVPVLNHGMPEQRTYSEWKFSDYSKATHAIVDPLGKRTGTGIERCQDCHMPTLKHEYSDANTGSLNPDPLLAGGFPYGKDRGPEGGTTFHKLVGANRDLPLMMKALYPEVDVEVIGWPTGKDPRTFPGMLSDRGPLWDRAARNTEISLRDSMDVQVVQAPTEVSAGVYEMKVKVTNKSGHRIPSGYPDGRRFWLEVKAKNGSDTVYESGYYDPTEATLKTTPVVAFNRAQTNVIDATIANAVMVYERVTGTCTDSGGTSIFPDPTTAAPAACTPSTSLLNNFLLFDNRVPPKGLDYTNGRLAGVKFWNYAPVTFVPAEDATRYDAAALEGGYDIVTYRFSADPGLTLTATAEAYWQTHTRPFMEHLRDQDTTTVRPQGPPDPFALGYPFTPNYLSNSINGKPLAEIEDPFRQGVALNDNWGGVAYAAWLETGKGAPFLVDRYDTTVSAAPEAPENVTVQPTGEVDPVTGAPDVFAARIAWDPAANADGYTVWVRYGKDDATADWDRLAVVDANTTSFVEHVFNPDKTYGFKVVAFNSLGESAASTAVSYKTAADLPAAPTNLTASRTLPGSTGEQITLTWFDNATNAVCFDVWRFDIVAAGQPPATALGCVAGGNPQGSVTYVDNSASLTPVTCYMYQVRAQNNNGEASTWSQQAQGCTIAATPAAPSNAQATVVPGAGGPTDPDVQVTFTDNATNETGFVIQRSVNGGAFSDYGNVAANVTTFLDTGVNIGSTYRYQVAAQNGTVVRSAYAATNPVEVGAPPAPPTGGAALLTAPNQVRVRFQDNSELETGFVVERAVNGGAWAWLADIGQQGGGTVTYFDNTVLANGSYQYRIAAVNGALRSAYTTTGSVVTVPAAPSQVAVTAVRVGNSARYTVTWKDNSGYETGFLVQRATNAGFTAGLVPTAATTQNAGQNVVTFTVNNLSRSTRYYWRVRATNPAGNSDWSLTVSLPTPIN